MAFDEQFIHAITQKNQKRQRLLEQFGIQSVPTIAHCVKPEDPAPTGSPDRYYADKSGGQYKLPSDKDYDFNQLLDRITEEGLQDNREKQIKEFLEPFKEN